MPQIFQESPEETGSRENKATTESTTQPEARMISEKHPIPEMAKYPEWDIEPPFQFINRRKKSMGDGA